jgi:hypothetical protein
VRLKELGIPVEREWWIDEEGNAYVVDLALPVQDGLLPVTFGVGPARQAARASKLGPSPIPACGRYWAGCAPLKPDIC